MLQRLRKWSEDQRGVTLIELMVVVAILAVIAAVAVPMVTTSLKESKANTDKQNAAILMDAVSRWRFGESPEGANPIPEISDLVPKYLQQIPAHQSGNVTCADDEEEVPSDASGAQLWCLNLTTGEMR